ncbi:hypothetical protein [Scytonema sp. NUACC21]
MGFNPRWTIEAPICGMDEQFMAHIRQDLLANGVSRASSHRYIAELGRVVKASNQSE